MRSVLQVTHWVFLAPAPFACLLAWSPPAPASVPCRTTLSTVPDTTQRHTNDCVLAATRAIATHHAVHLDARQLARAVPRYIDGTDLFELLHSLPDHGLHGLALQLGGTQLAHVVEAGEPVIAMLRKGDGKHAVVVTGVRRAPATGSGCGAVRQLELMDPAAGRRAWVDLAVFERAQHATQAVLITRTAHAAWDALSRAGLAVSELRRQDARFRASGWLRRVAEHPRINRQSLVLTRHAVSADPCWAEARDALRDIRRSLGPAAPPPVELPSCVGEAVGQ